MTTTNDTQTHTGTVTHLPRYGHRHAARPTAMQHLAEIRDRERRLLGDESRLDPARPADADALALLAALKTFADGPETTFVSCADVEATLAVPMARWPTMQAWVRLWEFGLIALMSFQGRNFARLVDALDRAAMRRSGEPVRSVDL